MCSLRLLKLLSFSLLMPLAGCGPSITIYPLAEDCISPSEARRGVFAYRVSGEAPVRAQVVSVTSAGSSRLVDGPRNAGSGSSIFVGNVADPAATPGIVAYQVSAQDASGGAMQTREVRYRSAVMELTGSLGRLAPTNDQRTVSFQINASVRDVTGIGCRVVLDATVDGVRSRNGAALFASSRLRCDVRWDTVAQAKSAGRVEWSGGTSDTCQPNGRTMAFRRFSRVQ